VRPPFTYKAVLPDEVRFMPLQGEREMTPAEILRDHEKGRAYASVLEGKKRYPIILDSEGTVLSFPPIINGIATAVKETTRDIFVDCTGTDLNAVKCAVDILTTALAERGGKIKTVEIKSREGTSVAPDLAPRAMRLDVQFVNRWIGTAMDPNEMTRCLMKLGHGATAKDNHIEVLVPAYRADVIHPVDLAEDVAIGHGFENFGNRLPAKSTFGSEDELTSFSTRVKPILTGLGYLEVVTLSLSSPEEQYTMMNLDIATDRIRISNPVSEEHTQIRTSLLPSLLAILRKNKHRDLPQRVFEVGETGSGAGNRAFVSGMSVHSKAGFTEMKSDVQSLIAALGLQMDVMKSDHPSYVAGRCAKVSVDGVDVGVFGELAPSTITSFGLGYPVSVFELDLEALLRMVNAE
jgi:phenylalanyl-tRNA synthetase beta chain